MTGLALSAIYAGMRNYNAHKREIAITKAIKEREEQLKKLSYEDDEESSIKETTVYNASGAAACAMPAVVSIGVTGVSYTYDFFGREYSYEQTGNASGIIAAQNYGEVLIVTNNHVIEGAASVMVTFIDGNTAPAEIRSTEESEDLAVISVNISDIKAETLSKIRIATFANSEELVPGEMVIAIGNSLGYGQSVTVGYVSALNREVTIDGYTLKLIQTDVAINPGNSGGALLNANGEIVGINNAKIASSDVEGICYAIPTSTAIPIIDDLMVRKYYEEDERAALGIKGQEISDDQALFYNIPRGIYVKEVIEGSSADQAGLKNGDIIVAVNGKKVLTSENYEKVLAYISGGSEGTVTVKRLIEGDYREETVAVTFGYGSKR